MVWLLEKDPQQETGPDGEEGKEKVPKENGAEEGAKWGSEYVTGLGQRTVMK